METWEKIALPIVIFLFFFMVITITHYENAQDIACIKAGFEKYTQRASFQFCVDNEGNFHYIELVKTEGWLFRDYMAKSISVGNMRVIN